MKIDRHDRYGVNDVPFNVGFLAKWGSATQKVERGGEITTLKKGKGFTERVTIHIIIPSVTGTNEHYR